MPVIHNVNPRSTDAGNQLLQHSYLIAAVAIVFVLVVLRIVVLRWHNRTLSDFFRIGGRSQHPYGSYPPHGSNHGSIYHGLQLAPLPAAYHPDRRVRATDTDADGRRLGPGGEDWDGKDALPAYNNFDRPPKYVEAGWTHPSTEQPAATPSSWGEQSGMAHTVDRVFADDYNTHALAGATGARLPQAHHDLSSR